jgi:excisionase family DNA binding protein
MIEVEETGSAGLPPLLTPAEVQKILRLSRAKVYRMLRLKEIPSVRIGRAVRIPRDRFISWLEKLVSTGSEKEGKTSLRRVF